MGRDAIESNQTPEGRTCRCSINWYPLPARGLWMRCLNVVSLTPNSGFSPSTSTPTTITCGERLRIVTPWIVVVEHNPTIPAYIDYFDPEDEVFFLCSAAALERLGQEKGYRLVACTRSNSIFVRSDLWSADWLPDKSVIELFTPFHRRRWIVDSQTLPDHDRKNRYPGFFAGPGLLRPMVKALRRAQAKISDRPFVEPSKQVRKRAAAAGIHCP